jgi:hypothetical protein
VLISPSSTAVKNAWNYTSSPPMYFHGVDRDNFTLLIIHWLSTHVKYEFRYCADFLNRGFSNYAL